MASEKQIEGNRRNAAKSTGPSLPRDAPPSATLPYSAILLILLAELGLFCHFFVCGDLSALPGIELRFRICLRQ